jgi:hypothetical protein
MATTTNYGWTTPDDTALVKDGASAIRTLGTAIDTTVFTNASAGIAKTIVDAKGDIIAATAADTVSRLAVGANDTVLTADSTAATGLKWATPAAGGMTLLSTTTLSGATTTISSISQSYNTLFAVITGITSTTDGRIRCAPNANTTSSWSVNFDVTAVGLVKQNATYMSLLPDDPRSAAANANNAIVLQINNYTGSTYKSYSVYGTYFASAQQATFGFGGIGIGSAITSLVFSNSLGNLSTGTVLLYGVK